MQTVSLGIYRHPRSLGKFLEKLREAVVTTNHYCFVYRKHTTLIKRTVPIMKIISANTKRITRKGLIPAKMIVQILTAVCRNSFPHNDNVLKPTT